MSLKSLTNAEMVQTGEILLDPKGDETSPRKQMEANPTLAPLVPILQHAQTELIASQPTGGAALSAITERLTLLDGRHDNLCRGIDARLGSEVSLAKDAKTAAPYQKARDALFPTGMSIVGRSYTEEAGEVKLREARVLPEHRETLGSLVAGDGATLLDHYRKLQKTGTELGQEEERREALGASGAMALKNGAARNQWIRTVNGIAAVLAALGIDEQKVLRAVRTAEAIADRRNGGTGGEVVDPTVGDQPVTPVTPVTPTE